MRPTICLAIVTLSIGSATCSADAPSVSYIFPAGGQRGTTVDFHVGGHYLHDACPFEMLGPGVTASQTLLRADTTLWFEGPVIPLPDSQSKEDYPWAQNGTVSIAVDAPLGFRRWRVWTSQGVTESMKFVIGDLPEIIEQEVDGDPIPTQVELPVTINGRMFPREDIDIWTFQAKAGTSYTCEVMANRLGSPLDSRIAVFDPQGNLIAENVDGKGVDSLLRFVALEDGDYAVHIHDINFDGLQHFVYRLTITDQPYVDQVYPLGGRRGAKTEFRLLGQAVPDEAVAITLDEAVESSQREQFIIDGHRTNECSIELSNHPEVIERGARESDTLSVPAVMNGCIEQPGEIDSWWITLIKGEQISFSVHAAKLGSMLDSVLRIYDESGAELASNDDAGDGRIDSALNYTATSDGRFRITVQDAFDTRGGNRFAYRLYAEPSGDAVPDFALQLPVDALTIERGTEVKLKVTATRTGKFEGAITLDAGVLPQGLSITGNTIPAKKNDTQLVFKASETASLELARLPIVGTAMIGKSTVSRRAIKPADSPDDLDFDELSLSVAIPTPFKVVGDFETRYAARGSTFSRHYRIDRGSYDGPITIRMAERQVRHLQGVTGPTMLVPPGDSEFDYPIKLPPWMEVGRTSRTAVMAVADVMDEAGEVHRVSYTSHAQNDQVIVLVDPGQLDLRLGHKSLVADRQTHCVVPFHVGRGQGIEGPVEVRAIVPAHIKGVKSEAVLLAANESDGVLQFSFADGELGPWNMPLVVRATATHDGSPYTAEATLAIVPHEPQSQAISKLGAF
ncbi:MAG: PPC domain-containing protein [Planctomycetaceae bacterium]|nr:PPC domain-containing protein [Planctomycetales bacterium]MCB9922665.1 PPC domain-containing protein [Planctomycetaceae bacterium]